MVHPGLLHSRPELNFIQQKIQTGQQPWKSAWDQLQSAEVASLDYSPSPTAGVVRGVRNNPNIGSSDMSRDAAAAYAHALQWSLTQNAAHAKKAIEILNAWADTLESVSGHDAKLLVGMDGVAFCNAAELIRHTSTQWRAEDQKTFERMLRQVFYPVIKDFFPTANGNWDASMIQTMIAMGIYLDDHAMFDRAADYFLQGSGNGAIENYLNEWGQCQESGRDQSHVQMGLGFLACACEMAWKQGVDLYAAADNRLAMGFEYTAKYNLGDDVPYQRYRSVGDRYDYPAISSKGRGRFRPIYQRVVHHYHDRMGMDMPSSLRVADQERPEGSHRQHMSWGTLTSFGLPEEKNATQKNATEDKDAPGGISPPKDAATNNPAFDESTSRSDFPVVLGHGVGRFKVGTRMARDHFETLDNWVVQIQPRSGFAPAKVMATGHSLDCQLPGRGCTVWFKQKLPTRVAITYDVLCPTSKPAIRGQQPRDINNFWMATDPLDRDLGLFDSDQYTGKFSTYDKLHGYYASTGGGGSVANLTTRMRRYPREVDGKPSDHLALNDKDGKPGYLITPDKVMSVQLVAFDDVIQYVVDGKLIYQIAAGDPVQIEGRDSQGKPTVRQANYDVDRFPVYRQGYFGFRMVGTHHIYTNFQVFHLEPADGTKTKPAGAPAAVKQ
ncbi:Alginate lyase [Rubripirellula lacrimiformis]|uniref:Alginate lyase n=2 Tax=Rubripirellula lacrimiformis TaxID=1930273 RepID=A0A517ND37_9BACT|nr:Alginate lyase [Rubripirellula lacrimiformis]